jgi:hypothetical protein
MPNKPTTALKAPQPFVNPYLGYEGPTNRLNAIVPLPVFHRLKQCRLGNGTIQITVNILIAKLIHELDRHGIAAIADEREFEYLVANCKLSCPGVQRRGDASLQSNAGTNVEPKRSGPAVAGQPPKGESDVGTDLSGALTGGNDSKPKTK